MTGPVGQREHEDDPRPEATPQDIVGAVQLALEFSGMGKDADVLTLIDWIVQNEQPGIAGSHMPVRVLVAAARATKPREAKP